MQDVPVARQRMRSGVAGAAQAAAEAIVHI